MQDNELTTAVTMRVSAATHRGLLRQALQEPRSLAGQAAYLLEQTRTLSGGEADAAPAARAAMRRVTDAGDSASPSTPPHPAGGGRPGGAGLEPGPAAGPGGLRQAPGGRHHLPEHPRPPPGHARPPRRPATGDARPGLAARGRGRGRRRLRLDAEAMAALRPHRARQNAERVALGPDHQDYGLGFATHDGAPLNYCNVTRAFKRLLARAGRSPTVRFYDPR